MVYAGLGLKYSSRQRGNFYIGPSNRSSSIGTRLQVNLGKFSYGTPCWFVGG